MKKKLIKMALFVITFMVSLIVIGKIMNKGHDNITMEMTQATLPVITMERNGVEYNRLHGYNNAMNPAFQRDVVTPLTENRGTGYIVNTYGRNVTGISIEVRNIDGTRLIESTPLKDYTVDGDLIRGAIALKDLIDRDTEYMMTILLELDEEQEVRYYTRVIWSDKLYTDEKLAFVLDFHGKLYDREAARELAIYLETNGQLEDNSSFHTVNIHSSFRQITWGELPVSEIDAPMIQLTEIASQTSSMLVDYMVATGEGQSRVYYRVKEYYRIRYTTDRVYLLDYERTMTQIPDVDNMYGNDKILLGITDTNVPMRESEDGNIIVFEVADRLLSYNVTTNKLAVIFSFYDEENADYRTLYDAHRVKILDVDEGGNVWFAVYGYMNRGRHEGEVGIALYNYNSELNTIEESVYLPYDKNYAVLQAEMDRLLYLNRAQKLYLSLENSIYCIDLMEKTYQKMTTVTQDNTVQVSDNNRILVSLLWDKGTDIYHCTQMSVQNLNNETQNVISVRSGEALRPLGFMGEDIIYGVARTNDIVEENSGRIVFPMYKVCICDSDGNLLKTYEQSDIYVTDCTIVGNQISLIRQKRLEDGSYIDTADDQIMNNMETDNGKNVIVAADIDVYERYVQIQTRTTIDSKNIKILTPKEVVFEGGRELILDTESSAPRYYVYGPYGVSGIYSAPATAVNLAYDISGVVIGDHGECIWLKGNRVLRNQIMAIKEETVTGTKDSLAVCLDTMLKFEGVIRNSEYLLGQGQSVKEILERNLDGAQVLDLTGCNLDSILYYVNQDIPVLALLKNGEAVLVTGFNEYNVVIMDPVTGTLYKKGMNDSTEWFAENGNSFITYVWGE
ncbi:MAG: hypothetical protein NC417_06730 [Candidatus Gastranaerophilales bacterium]|nr:hypothetical protein [Candidatus Gastranaerophilales bacterium]